MKKHKWAPLKMNVEAYKCEKCGCEKIAVSYNYGGWEYGFLAPFPANKKSFIRPDCI